MDHEKQPRHSQSTAVDSGGLPINRDIGGVPSHLSDDTAQPRRGSGFKGMLRQLPTFKEFVSEEWKDLLPMLILTAITLPVNTQPPLGQRYFPVVTQEEGNVDVSQHSYPYREQIITVPVSAVLATIPPIVIFVLAQIKLKSYRDLHASIYGLVTTLVMGTFIQVIMKTVVGGLRPYFYDACKPDPAKTVPGTGIGYNGMMFNSSVCTGVQKEINKAMSSFPSGHSNAAMGSALFLALYLNGKLKTFGNTRARFWKLFCFFFPLLFSAAICGSLTLDQSHNWYDVVVGATIGIACAFMAYRSRYAAIWDYRFNHIPLPKASTRERLGRDDDHHDTVLDAEDGSAAPRKGRKFFGGGRKQKKYHTRLQRFPYALDHPDMVAHPVLTRKWMGGGDVGAPGDAYMGHTHPNATEDVRRYDTRRHHVNGGVSGHSGYPTTS